MVRERLFPSSRAENDERDVAEYLKCAEESVAKSGLLGDLSVLAKVRLTRQTVSVC
jgi:hypothetical protein